MNPRSSLSIRSDGTARLREEDSAVGSVRAATSAGCSSERVTCQIPAVSGVVAAYVEVWSDAETTRSRIDVPTDIGRSAEKGPWFVVKSWHEYIGSARVFTVYLENWSQATGCQFQLHVTFEIGRRR